jgi:rubrerythrin
VYLNGSVAAINRQQEKEMFTIGDIRNIAIQLERNGEETYRNAGKAVRDPHVARVLAWMADQEQCHAQWFETVASTKPLTQELQQLEDMGRTLLQDMVKGDSFLLDQKELEQAESAKKVIARSKDFERDTIVFYEVLLGFLDDEDTIQQLKRIIGEEQNHIRELEHLEEQSNRISND